MWYAVETAFIDGEHLGSYCVFQDGDTGPVGHCYSKEKYPINMCEKKFNDRIEIHVDWFESEELAHQFSEGKITYCHIFETWKGRQRFIRREILKADQRKGILPYRGIQKVYELKERPWWIH